MDEFVKRSIDQLLEFKKNIFKHKHAVDFIEKLTRRGDMKVIESELNKCLLPKSVKNKDDIKKRKDFIENFLSEFAILREKEKKAPPSENPPTANPQNPQKDFQWRPNLKFDDDHNFPSLDSHELLTRKKNFVVLDKHYKNKLEPGIHKCYCMSQKHPLVGICTNCGRIHCLQEGDKKCIECGHPLLPKEKYMSNIVNDNIAKNAFGQKEKLLRFQADFYSKLKIVDDFTDWYEVSNNTWLCEADRELAQRKDEQSEITEKII